MYFNNGPKGIVDTVTLSLNETWLTKILKLQQRGKSIFDSNSPTYYVWLKKYDIYYTILIIWLKIFRKF